MAQNSSLFIKNNSILSRARPQMASTSSIFTKVVPSYMHEWNSKEPRNDKAWLDSNELLDMVVDLRLDFVSAYAIFVHFVADVIELEFENEASRACVKKVELEFKPWKFTS